MDQAKEKRLETIRNSIEKLSKQHHIETLKILKARGATISENRNGVYINLSYISDSIIEELENYLKYVCDQEAIIEDQEKVKRDMEIEMNATASLA